MRNKKRNVFFNYSLITFEFILEIIVMLLLLIGLILKLLSTIFELLDGMFDIIVEKLEKIVLYSSNKRNPYYETNKTSIKNKNASLNKKNISGRNPNGKTAYGDSYNGTVPKNLV